jgi:putative MATE family efflux protein
MKKFDEEIVSGSILRSIWKLAWPIALLNLINGIQGFVNQIMIGHFIDSPDKAANAAIGASWQVFLVFIVLIVSIFHGMNVLVARYCGQQDRDKASRVAYEAFLLTVYAIFFVLGPIGYILAPWILDLAVEPQSKAYGLPYLRILFLCGMPMFVMFMMTGAFNASGDPKTPLILGVLATILNVLISLVLIPGVDPFDVSMPGGSILHVPLYIPALGTSGAALGTVGGPTVSAVIGLTLVMRRKMILQPPTKYTFFPDFKIVREIARIGIPTGIQGIMLNLGGFITYIFLRMTEEPAAAQAAYTIAYIQLFSLITWPSFGLRAACGTVMGQNIGANKPDRGKKAVVLAAAIAVGWGLFIGFFFMFAPGGLFGIFNATEEPVFGYGKLLLSYLFFSGVLLAPTLAMTGGLQGAGATKIPMFIALFTQFVSIGLLFLLHLGGALTAGNMWVVILAGHTIRFTLTLAVFRKDGWIHTKVGFED